MLDQMTSGLPVRVPSSLLYTASGCHAFYGDAKINYGVLLESPYAGYLAGGLFDGSHTNAEVGSAAPPNIIPSRMLAQSVKDDLLKHVGQVYKLLAAFTAIEMVNQTY